MTPNELITFINDEITSNGNNEITADVLRPVLVAMVNQINDLVGNENNLPNGTNTVIEALNTVTNTKLRNFKLVTDGYLILDSDDVIAYEDAADADIVMPEAEDYEGRILTIVNQSEYVITLSEKYYNVFGDFNDALAKQRALRIISDGEAWQEISNTETSV